MIRCPHCGSLMPEPRPDPRMPTLKYYRELADEGLTNAQIAELVGAPVIRVREMLRNWRTRKERQ